MIAMESKADSTNENPEAKPPVSAEAGASKSAEVVEQYPDPDEDDLDDLDGMHSHLDNF